MNPFLAKAQDSTADNSFSILLYSVCVIRIMWLYIKPQHFSPLAHRERIYTAKHHINLQNASQILQPTSKYTHQCVCLQMCIQKNKKFFSAIVPYKWSSSGSSAPLSVFFVPVHTRTWCGKPTLSWHFLYDPALSAPR